MQTIRLAISLTVVTAFTAHAIGQTTTRDSLTSAGAQDPLGGNTPALSADGRFIAFRSTGSTLVPGDTNGASDIFVRDRVTGQTTRVSVDSAGLQANDNSFDPELTADGRYVVFRSAASNLVAGDTNNMPDIFRHDRQTGTTIRVSVGAAGQQPTQPANGGVMSDDGRYVVFYCGDNTLVPGDICVQSDVFCRDCLTGTTALISTSLLTGQTFNPRSNPRLSSAGEFIVFQSTGDDLAPNDFNGWSDIFVWSRATNSISLVSVGSSGNQGNSGSSTASVSADGRFVAFASNASNFLAGDTTDSDVFVRDRLLGQLTCVSLAPGGQLANGDSFAPSISGDGRFVVFWSTASNLVAGDTNGVYDVFVHDRATNTTSRASVSAAGAQGTGQSTNGKIAQGGRYIAFDSTASNLVVPDTNLTVTDCYVRDLGATASVMAYGAGCPGTGLLVPGISNVGWPLIGNAAFGIGVHDGLAQAPAGVFWSTAAGSTPLDGCDVLLGAPVNTLSGVMLDAMGSGVTALPIPNDQTLLNVDLFFQALVLDVNGPFLGLGALSNGLAVHIAN
jgi:hypothetical protein